MKELKIQKEKNQLQNEVNQFNSILRKQIENSSTNLKYQVKFLANLRKEIYENINQLQHKALLIRAAEILQKKYPTSKFIWFRGRTFSVSELEKDRRQEFEDWIKRP